MPKTLIGGCENYQSESIFPTEAEKKAKQPCCGLCVTRKCNLRRNLNSTGTMEYPDFMPSVISTSVRAREAGPFNDHNGSVVDNSPNH